MKNIAIPVLMTSSARAVSNTQMMMKQDHATPKPILIASAWHDGTCQASDGAVADAIAALSSAQGALDTAIADRAAFDTAVTEARDAKALAVQAVVDADVLLADDLAADDAAQQAEMNAKIDLDSAAIAMAVALANKDQGDLDLDDATSAKDAAVLIQTAMNTAAEEADEHLTFETDAYDIWVGKVADQLLVKNNAFGEIAGYEVLRDGAYNLWDAKNQETAGKQGDVNDLTALHTALTALKVSSAAAIVTGSDTLFDLKATADANVVTTDYDNAANAYKALCETAVEAYAAWIAAEAWTTVGNATDDCNGTGETEITSDVSTLDECKALCTAKLAWGMSGDLPTGAALVADGATYCYGIAWKANSCITYGQAAVTGDDGSGNNTSLRECYKRTKTTLATALVDGTAASLTSVTAYATTYETELTDLGTLTNLQDDAVARFDVGVDYDTDLGTQVAATLGDKNDDQDDLDALELELSPLLITYNTKNQDLTDANQTHTTAESLYNSYVTSRDNALAEKDAQTDLKAIADAEKVVQDALVDTLDDLMADADAALNAADTGLVALHEAAVQTHSDAETDYNTAVDDAAGTAETVETPLSDLADLRVTAVDATTDLSDALGDLADQESTIADAQALVDEKTEEHLDAVVACKVANYEEYADDLADAEATRSTKLDDIEELLEGLTTPAAGTVNARCEKAVSNGTFRPKRNEETCTGETVCCGAAKIPMGNVIMTVETCQEVTTEKYAWAPPRAPMETEMPDADDYLFQCIQGAQKLAAATSALATAVYMLA